MCLVMAANVFFAFSDINAFQFRERFLTSTDGEENCVLKVSKMEKVILKSFFAFTLSIGG